MNFNSISFAIFLPVVFLIYWLCLRNRTRSQNIFLLVASYLFYAWWDWRFLFLIIITTASTYSTALAAKHGNKRTWTVANIILNLGILATFKYFNFFSENLRHILSAIGMAADWVTLDILLPAGISFYTFQAISYSVDVYRDRIKPTRDYIAFSTFIAFFPQLVAGPIERATNLLPQITSPRHWEYNEAVLGMRQILWGLAKKLAMADLCGQAVDAIFSQPHYYASEFGASTLILGSILFSFQIYGDFSGYSDIATGSARLFGIRLMDNFRHPYFSRNVREFWQRWHISLMQWFREYLYIPLGGNRNGLPRTLLNISIVFLISGLWHGAAWTFVAWGAFWAIFMCIGIIFNSRRYRPDEIASWKDTHRIVIVFLLVSIGFTIFRSQSIDAAIDYFGLIFHSGGLLAVPTGLTPLWSVVLVIGAEWYTRRHPFPLQRMPRSAALRFAIYWLLLGTILWACDTDSTSFIYFRF
ncbi:MAG: MBOAT family protein [Muribaculaceae bacterium]|nr:MBOAT family protein [Muribaculaceae bacterium]